MRGNAILKRVGGAWRRSCFDGAVHLSIDRTTMLGNRASSISYFYPQKLAKQQEYHRAPVYLAGYIAPMHRLFVISTWTAGLCGVQCECTFHCKIVLFRITGDLVPDAQRANELVPLHGASALTLHLFVSFVCFVPSRNRMGLIFLLMKSATCVWAQNQ